MKNLIFSFALLAAAFSLHAQNPALKPFYHGVASGDALSDRVIIWTRVSDTTGTVSVDWKMASDEVLSSVVQSGTATTDTSKDFTVKVDVTGLQPDTWYYYQFTTGSKTSVTGRTKTLPIGNVDHVRVAVVTCEDYDVGLYYNAFNSIAKRNKDIQAVIHLGDYIYEYAAGGISGHGVQIMPDHECLTLADYRTRYNTYRLDPDLQKAHQQYPFYNVWDDHEVANNSWLNGAENHTPATEGDYQVRKAQAQKAYFEWVPIREQAPGSHRIYREFNFGNLIDLIMLDTRHEGRDEQVALTDQNALEDTNRTILGATQRQWLFDKLDNSQATWRVVGQQVMIAPLKVFGAYVNNDQWDGYQGDRKRVTDYVVNNNITNVVWLTGDIHSSWANDVPQTGVTYDPATGDGSAFVEYVTPSITSGGFPFAVPLTTIQQSSPHVKYADLTQKGYIILDVNADRAQSDWYFVSTITDSNYTLNYAESWYVNNGERFLRKASGPATGISEPVTRGSNELPVTVFPNPFENKIQIRLNKPIQSPVAVKLYNVLGKSMYETKFSESESSGILSVDVNSLPPGNYLLMIESGTATSRIPVLKAR